MEDFTAETSSGGTTRSNAIDPATTAITNSMSPYFIHPSENPGTSHDYGTGFQEQIGILGWHGRRTCHWRSNEGDLGAKQHLCQKLDIVMLKHGNSSKRFVCEESKGSLD
ncbi:hypothetical protein PIB30_013865 [Stylosanthes scabra]|uniref:Uncharacterized protein n=1 Tax=Stylosanthes scabra TaxID=79078 RepID=A0ABU6U960_9FABA|nr:hypothetical protein [Stylosanthes scabra]